MGTVYRAEHRSSAASAAIKVLLAGAGATTRRGQRFFNEARAANAIAHPASSRSSTSARAGRPRPHVMELLEGETLARGCDARRGCRSPRRCASRGSSPARWRRRTPRGIVHRDLKPDNIFLVPRPERPGGERVKVLDFGIAKLRGDAGDARDDRRPARDGHARVHVARAVPRLATSRPRAPTSTRSACILYEMLCGRGAVPSLAPRASGEVLPHAHGRTHRRRLSQARRESPRAVERALISGRSPRAQRPLPLDGGVPRRAGGANADAGAGPDVAGRLAGPRRHDAALARHGPRPAAAVACPARGADGGGGRVGGGGGHGLESGGAVRGPGRRRPGD